MSNGFEKQEIQSEAEKQKEVKKMSPDFAHFKALVSLRDLQKSGLGEAEAIDQVVNEFNLDRVAFTDYMKQVENAKTSSTKNPRGGAQPKKRFHTDEEIQRYQESRPDLF